ncbi:MAG: hypothetical protein CVU72_07490, partial [Deltaproteobacteria bacterium HGW-Deltaproteobacteria-7]
TERGEAAGRPQASVGEFQDVRAALENSEARYRVLVRHSSDGVFLFDPRTLKILEANASFLKITRYREEEITRLALPDIVAMKKKAIVQNVRSVLRNTEIVSGLRQYRRKDGTFVDVEISSSLINYRNQEFIMVNVRDVTERLRAQHELERQASMLRDQAEIIDIAEDAIIVRDMRNHTLFWNKGAENRFGFSRNEAWARPLSSLLRTRYPAPFSVIRRHLISEGKWEGELIHRTKDGRPIVVESKWKLRRDKKGRPVAVLQIENDITQRKLAADVLKRSKEELERRVAERTSELTEANARLVQELKRRQQVEDMLRRGAELYKNLFENSPIGIYRTDPRGRILMANPTLIRMMGYSSFVEFG